MADSLVDLVSNYFDPNVTTKLAASLGIDLDHIQAIVDAAVPATLTSLAGAAASPDGAAKIAAAVGGADQSLLDNLPDMATNKNLSDGGLQLLGALVGSQKVDAIASAVAGATGSPAAATRSIIGVLGSATIGALAQLDPGSWSSGAAIAQTFAAQKSAITAALPAGLATALTGAAGGLASGVGSMAGVPSSVAANIRQPAAGAPGASNAAASRGIPSWVWIAVAIIILAGLYWYFKMR